jgi:hypothetical protein
MVIEEMVETAVAEFKQNLLAFGETRDWSVLTPELAEGVCKDLMRASASACVASFCTLLRSYEVEQDVVFAHGETFRFKAVRERAYLLPFGEVVVPRRCFQNKSDSRSYVPLDTAWGMEGGQYMCAQLRDAVGYACALVTPEEAVQLMGKCAMIAPSATAIKHVVEEIGDLVANHRETLDHLVRAKESVPEDTQVMVVSVDGATVLLNEPGLRFGRPAERPGGKGPEQTPTSYRVSMVGSVSYYGAPPEPGETMERLETRYVAHMPEERCPTFKSMLEAEVVDAQAQAPPGIPRILLLDGAREIWNYLDSNPLFDNYHRCIDYWHTLEHLSVAAEALFGNSDEAKAWYEKYRAVLLETDDAAKRIVRSIDYYQERLHLNKTRRKHLGEQRTFFKRNGARMPYARFRAKNWPIGSGPIEAACKTLVKTRLCRSGMRWSRKGGQRILALRTYVKSERWDIAWQYLKHLHYRPLELAA